MKITGEVRLHKSEVKDISKLRTILTVSNPEYETFFKHRNPKFARKEDIPDEEICFLRNEGKDYIVPRNIPISLVYADVLDDFRSEGARIFGDFTFGGTLRKYQDDFLAGIPYEHSTDFVLEVPCGHGKTVMGLWLASQYKVRTIVLVPTLYLANQWLSEANTLLPKAKVSIYELGGDYRGNDILIINLDRVNAADFDEGFWNYFGLCISDEAHRDGAYTYYPIVNRLNTRRRIGLTATFRRGDQMHMILRYVFGNVYKMESKYPPALVIPFKTGIKFDEKDYLVRSQFRRVESLSDLSTFNRVYVTKPGDRKKLVATVKKGIRPTIEFGDGEMKKFRIGDYDTITAFIEKANFTKLDTLIAEDKFRNKILISLMVKLLRGGRTVLFLSKRRAYLENFNRLFTNRGYKSVIVVGGMKKAEQKETMDYVKNDAQIIFGIDKLAKEGLDAPRVDTLILHHPLKDVEQAKGRIERFFDGKKDPLVFYVLDENEICYSIFRASQRYLKGSKISRPVFWSEYFKSL